MRSFYFNNEQNLHLGLLILRIGTGIIFILHGAPKILGGPEAWEEIGSNMAYVNIEFGYGFWGFMAAISEFVGGILLAAGLFFVPACILLMATMSVASVSHLAGGDGFVLASHALEAAILFFSLIFIGPGKYSLSKIFQKRI